MSKNNKFGFHSHKNSNLNAAERTPERSILKNRDMLNSPSGDSEISNSAKRDDLRSQKSKAVTIASSYTIYKNSQNLMANDGLDNIGLTTDNSRRKSYIGNTRMYDLNSNEKTPDINVGSDFEYDDESFIEED